MQSPPKKAKTGGRKAGTPNKATAARVARLGAGLFTGPHAGARTYVREAGGAPDDAFAAEMAAFPRYRLARVDDLVPYENNARTHTPAQIDLIAALIREYGFTNPVLVDGNRGVVAGHGRVLAARKLGMAVVPTIELSHLSEQQRRAYVIADNQSALKGGWDDSILALELGELKDSGFDLALSGFDAVELAALLDDPAAEPEPVPRKGTSVRCPACGAYRAAAVRAAGAVAPAGEAPPTSRLARSSRRSTSSTRSAAA